MIVEIDNKEKGRIKPALYYFSQNNTVNISELQSGDYLFTNDDGKTCAFEYKTCSDFIRSVNEHKVFNQAIEQANQYDFHFVCLQYTDKERQLVCDKLWYDHKIVFTKSQFYGAIASLNTFTTVIPGYNMKTCFELMETQARKCFKQKDVHKQLKKVNTNSAFNFLNNCIRGIGGKTAENITTELELYTLEDLMNLDKPLLLTVNGVGEKTADNILSKLKNDYKS